MVDPRVRAFAELALKEVRLGGGDGSDTSLLTDKAAFSEFMDKVNERYGTSMCCAEECVRVVPVNVS